MARFLVPEYEVTRRAEEADLYLINTCAIRRKSEEKLKSLLGSLKFLKAKNPRLILGVGGVARQEGERLLGRGVIPVKKGIRHLVNLSVCARTKCRAHTNNFARRS